MPICKVKAEQVIMAPSDCGFVVILPNQTHDGKPVTASRILKLLVKNLELEENLVLVGKMPAKKSKKIKSRR